MDCSFIFRENYQLINEEDRLLESLTVTDSSLAFALRPNCMMRVRNKEINGQRDKEAAAAENDKVACPNIRAKY